MIRDLLWLDGGWRRPPCRPASAFGYTPPPPPPTLNVVQQQVLEARRNYYPGTDAQLAHLPRAVTAGGRLLTPDEGGWPVVWWVPAGSTWQAPDGRHVHRASRFDPNASSSLAAAVGPNRVAVIKCPLAHENVVGGTGVINMRGAIILGHHTRNTQWLRSTPATVYRTPADAAAGTNGVPLRPGKWHYPSTEPNASAEHRQAVYAQGFSDAALDPGTLCFQAWEGLHIDGQWSPEGINWSRGASGRFRLVLAGFRQERVWVLYQQPGDDKRPGGDGVQLFTHLPQMVIVGATVSRTSLQAWFFQNNQSAPNALELFVQRYANSRGEQDHVTYGGSGSDASPGFQHWMSWDRTQYPSLTLDLKDVFVYAERGDGTPYPRNQLINRESQYPEVVVADVPDYVPAALTGAGYVSPEGIAVGDPETPDPDPVDPEPTGPVVRPTATNTGVPSGVTLTDMPASQLQNVSNVTLTRRRIVNDVAPSWDTKVAQFYGSNVTLTECDLSGMDAVFTGDDVLLERCQAGKVSGSGVNRLTVRDYKQIPLLGKDAIGVTSDSGASSLFTLDGAYLHGTVTEVIGPNPNAAEGNHYDAVQVRGCKGVLLKRLDIDMGPGPATLANSAVFIEHAAEYGAAGTNTDVVLEDSWLDAAGYYVLYLYSGTSDPTDLVVRRVAIGARDDAGMGTKVLYGRPTGVDDPFTQEAVTVGGVPYTLVNQP